MKNFNVNSENVQKSIWYFKCLRTSVPDEIYSIQSKQYLSNVLSLC